AGNNLGDPDVANQNPGTFGSNDDIKFAIPGAVLHTISVGSDASASGLALPALTKPALIDRYSQPASSPNTLPTRDNTLLLIGLDRSSRASGAGLTLGAGAAVRGLITNRFKGDGTHPTVGGGDVISGNVIGTDSTGLLARGNGGDGVLLLGPNNTVGGTSPA